MSNNNYSMRVDGRDVIFEGCFGYNAKIVFRDVVNGVLILTGDKSYHDSRISELFSDFTPEELYDINLMYKMSMSIFGHKRPPIANIADYRTPGRAIYAAKASKEVKSNIEVHQFEIQLDSKSNILIKNTTTQRAMRISPDELIREAILLGLFE